MNIKNIINVRKQANSFKNSFHGLKVAFFEEQSFKIQAKKKTGTFLTLIGLSDNKKE